MLIGKRLRNKTNDILGIRDVLLKHMGSFRNALINTLNQIEVRFVLAACKFYPISDMDIIHNGGLRMSQRDMRGVLMMSLNRDTSLSSAATLRGPSTQLMIAGALSEGAFIGVCNDSRIHARTVRNPTGTFPVLASTWKALPKFEADWKHMKLAQIIARVCRNM